MHYQLRVDGRITMNLPNADSAAIAARSIDPTVDHEHVVRALGEHGVFVMVKQHGIRITRSS